MNNTMKTKVDDKVKIAILENNVSERVISDERYAPMLVKVIVFGLVGLILMSVVGVIIGIFEKKTNQSFIPAQEIIDIK